MGYRSHAQAVRAIVEHAYRGCDSGCCGHEARAFDAQDKEVCGNSTFEFDHPWIGDDASKRKWAEMFAAEYFPGVPLDWGDCEVLDNC